MMWRQLRGNRVRLCDGGVDDDDAVVVYDVVDDVKYVVAAGVVVDYMLLLYWQLYIVTVDIVVVVVADGVVRYDRYVVLFVYELWVRLHETVGSIVLSGIWVQSTLLDDAVGYD